MVESVWKNKIFFLNGEYKHVKSTRYERVIILTVSFLVYTIPLHCTEAIF